MTRLTNHLLDVILDSLAFKHAGELGQDDYSYEDLERAMKWVHGVRAQREQKALSRKARS